MFARTRDKAPFATVPPRSMRRQRPLSPVWTTRVDSPVGDSQVRLHVQVSRAQRTRPQAAEPKRLQTAYNDESTPDWKTARTKFRAIARLSAERDRDHSRPHGSTRARRINEAPRRAIRVGTDLPDGPALGVRRRSHWRLNRRGRARAPERTADQVPLPRSAHI